MTIAGDVAANHPSLSSSFSHLGINTSKGLFLLWKRQETVMYLRFSDDARHSFAITEERARNVCPKLFREKV